MKIKKTQLKQIIKEELESALLSESMKNYIKSGAIHSSIPAGSLMRTLSKNPELSQQARNAADVQGQQQAFQEIGQLLAQDPDIVRATSMSGTRNELVDEVGRLKDAGYSQLTIQLVHGHEEALEEWAEVFHMSGL